MATNKYANSLDITVTYHDITQTKGLKKEEVAERYSKWAQEPSDINYAWDLREEHFLAPALSADFISDLYPDQGQRAEVNILDVAAGSGFAAEKLKMKGFLKIDALEPSEGMLNLAKEKNLYIRTFQAFLEPGSGVESDHYDVALICGGMGANHIPCSGMEEMIRMVKQGGYVVIVMREAFLTEVAEYKGRLEPLMEKLETQGRWALVSRTVVPKYYCNHPGVIFIFKVTETSGVKGSGA